MNDVAHEVPIRPGKEILGWKGKFIGAGMAFAAGAAGLLEPTQAALIFGAAMGVNEWVRTGNFVATLRTGIRATIILAAANFARVIGPDVLMEGQKFGVLNTAAAVGFVGAGALGELTASAVGRLTGLRGTGLTPDEMALRSWEAAREADELDY
ncbi:hypothetical protein A2368_04660 [Candidatus Collierbacteria bacterium RIFOXYB1_FULL_49_13]|uniref:Uncharacterized protein n=1 Tax=Candidatus Collierbacteria bacterium RIFOXYB1_FULL_49_13 TaxID=1817728 RepID=A0A1F5FJS1_9BACT|nr:MAG: hypothetical protein A2368_04660 [Candidatus Collierbacteria bacterium RIFOXYB1_FULL_49_13]